MGNDLNKLINEIQIHKLKKLYEPELAQLKQADPNSSPGDDLHTVAIIHLEKQIQLAIRSYLTVVMPDQRALAILLGILGRAQVELPDRFTMLSDEESSWAINFAANWIKEKGEIDGYETT